MVDHGPPQRHRLRGAALRPGPPRRLRRDHGAHGRHRRLPVRAAARALRGGPHRPTAEGGRRRARERDVLRDAGGERARAAAGRERRARPDHGLPGAGGQARGVPRPPRDGRSRRSGVGDSRALRDRDAPGDSRDHPRGHLSRDVERRRPRGADRDPRPRAIARRRDPRRLHRHRSPARLRHQLDAGVHVRMEHVHHQGGVPARACEQRRHVRTDGGHRAGGNPGQSDLPCAGEDEAGDRPLHPGRDPRRARRRGSGAHAGRVWQEELALPRRAQCRGPAILGSDLRERGHGGARDQGRTARDELSREFLGDADRGSRVGHPHPSESSPHPARLGWSRPLPRRMRPRFRVLLRVPRAAHGAGGARQARDRPEGVARRARRGRRRDLPQRRAGARQGAGHTARR